MQNTIENQIYPQAATGFGDTNAYLRELTLKSMLILAPKLSQKTLNQSLLKHLAKLQVRPPLQLNSAVIDGSRESNSFLGICKQQLQSCCWIPPHTICLCD